MWPFCRNRASSKFDWAAWNDKCPNGKEFSYLNVDFKVAYTVQSIDGAVLCVVANYFDNNGIARSKEFTKAEIDSIID